MDMITIAAVVAIAVVCGVLVWRIGKMDAEAVFAQGIALTMASSTAADREEIAHFYDTIDDIKGTQDATQTRIDESWREFDRRFEEMRREMDRIRQEIDREFALLRQREEEYRAERDDRVRTDIEDAIMRARRDIRR